MVAGTDVVATRRLTRALKRIFWGTALCLFVLSFRFERGPSSDPTLLTITASTGPMEQPADIQGFGFQFDLLNDVLGTILIGLGVAVLRKQRNEQMYVWGMTIVLCVTVAAGVNAAVNHFIFEHPRWLGTAKSAIELCTAPAIMVLCVCMVWLTQALNLQPVRTWWKKTTVLFAVIVLLPWLIGIVFRQEGLNVLSWSPDSTGALPNVLVTVLSGALFAVWIAPWIVLGATLIKMKRALQQ